MTLRVSGKNMDVGEALRGKAETHIDAVVKKYFDGGYDGHLTLEPEGIGFNAICSIHLDTGVVLQSSAYGGDAVSAYEMMSDDGREAAAALQAEAEVASRPRQRRQRRRCQRGSALHRARRARGRGRGRRGFLAAGDRRNRPRICRTMSVGEAVMLLDFQQSGVVMFRHAGHGGLNVVYRRADGNIGWIDPDLRAN